MPWTFRWNTFNLVGDTMLAIGLTITVQVEIFLWSKLKFELLIVYHIQLKKILVESWFGFHWFNRTFSKCSSDFGCGALLSFRVTGTNFLVAMILLTAASDLSAQGPTANCSGGTVSPLYAGVRDTGSRVSLWLLCVTSTCFPLLDPLSSSKGPGGCLWAQELWMWIFHGLSVVQKYFPSQCCSLRYGSEESLVVHLDSSFHCTRLWKVYVSLCLLSLMQGPTNIQTMSFHLPVVLTGQAVHLLSLVSAPFCCIASGNFPLGFCATGHSGNFPLAQPCDPDSRNFP